MEQFAFLVFLDKGQNESEIMEHGYIIITVLVHN